MRAQIRVSVSVYRVSSFLYFLGQWQTRALISDQVPLVRVRVVTASSGTIIATTTMTTMTMRNKVTLQNNRNVVRPMALTYTQNSTIVVSCWFSSETYISLSMFYSSPWWSSHLHLGSIVQWDGTSITGQRIHQSEAENQKYSFKTYRNYPMYRTHLLCPSRHVFCVRIKFFFYQIGNQLCLHLLRKRGVHLIHAGASCTRVITLSDTRCGLTPEQQQCLRLFHSR